MDHLALFNGIGGFQLPAHWMGWKNVAHVEIDPYCNKVVAKHFPNSVCHTDIKTFNGTKYRGQIDIITGGFPCQDISIANPNGEGIEGERSGLWKEARRVISEVRPGFVLLENSANLINKGLGTVLGDLAKIGYNAEWQCLHATTFGFQHGRERIFIIAYPFGKLLQRGFQKTVFPKQSLQRQPRRVSPGWRKRSDIPEPRNYRSANGFSGGLDRLKSLGNAIVTQAAYEIFQAIEQANQAPHP